MNGNDRQGLADVYVRYPVEGFFTYRIPETLSVCPGMRVTVNFRKRVIPAFVHRVHNNEPEGVALKEIDGVIDAHPIFDDRLIRFAEFVAANYLCTVGEVLALALPSGQGRSIKRAAPVPAVQERRIELTDMQQRIFKLILESREKPYHLIFGITGSGKTEIYIELAKSIIEKQQSVIYLVPEITISSQIYERVASVFGDQLILYHSRLTPNQRLSNWIRFYRGDARIAVGARSAVFLQCPDLGLVIIDEEHDASYKESSTPRYNARRLAMHRCKTEQAILVMGSATPSIESLYAAERGIFQLHQLTERYGHAGLPEIDIVRVKPDRPADLLSPRLRLHSKRAIEAGEQVILLLNRRGFAPILICNACGEAFTCPFCSISMNYHKDGCMHCHYCGYITPVNDRCVRCGSEDLVKLGSGTQRLEDTINTIFNNPRVFRLDQDSTRKKNVVFDLIDRMNRGAVDILLGTQMVAKGFDFHRVSTVGVILADIGINLPDFRSAERIFSLLMQVAGRCGRGAVAGKVIVQTLNDEHYLFDFLKRHDYYGFYRHELSMRKLMGYPPFSRIIRLLMRGKNEEKVIDSITALRTAIEEEIRQQQREITLLGPSPAPLPRIAGNYRYHLILKSKDIDGARAVVKSVKRGVGERYGYLEIDIDPHEIL